MLHLKNITWVRIIENLYFLRLVVVKVRLQLIIGILLEVSLKKKIFFLFKQFLKFFFKGLAVSRTILLIFRGIFRWEVIGFTVIWEVSKPLLSIFGRYFESLVIGCGRFIIVSFALQLDKVVGLELVLSCLLDTLHFHLLIVI